MDPSDLDVIKTCLRWQQAGRACALVTVVRTWGSSPRPPGAMMAVRDDGQVAGSVSGGCVEEELIATVREGGIHALTPGGRPRVTTYGVSAEEARRVGLPCGGTLQLVIEAVGAHSQLGALDERLAARRLTRRALDLHTGHVTLGDVTTAQAVVLDGDHLGVTLGPQHRLLVIGAGQLSRYVCQFAVSLGFDVTVCDPREEYLGDDAIPGVRFTRAMPDDAVLELRPDRDTAVVALTHDPKLDDLALMDALKTPAFYVGALGSRANNHKRRLRLQEHFGLSAGELAHLHGPAGLFIGSHTPAEIALSIMAEVVAHKNGVHLPRDERIDVATGKARGPAAACA